MFRRKERDKSAALMAVSKVAAKFHNIFYIPEPFPIIVFAF